MDSLEEKVAIARPGFGSIGKKTLALLTNHCKVDLAEEEERQFSQYTVSFCNEKGFPVEEKVRRKLLDILEETHSDKLNEKDLVGYDGDKTLFIIGSLPWTENNKLHFTVVLEDRSNNANRNLDGHGSGKRLRSHNRSKSFKVEMSLVRQIPLKAMLGDNENYQEATRALHIILRQHAAKQGCLLVGQDIFHNDPKIFSEDGEGGLLACRGFHSCFRTTQTGLSFNIDVSTTVIIKPGLVADFLIENQNVDYPSQLDWSMAKRTLKNFMIKTSHSDKEFKIRGLSKVPCNEQLFILRKKGGSNREEHIIEEEITVSDYFQIYHEIELHDSTDLPCIDVGKPKCPIYRPMELCSLISLQRYTCKPQKLKVEETSRQNPQNRMMVLSDALESSNYGANPMLEKCGVSIKRSFTQVKGRVLEPPVLIVKDGEELHPMNGRWSMTYRKFAKPATTAEHGLDNWAIVDFSGCDSIDDLVDELIHCGLTRGIRINDPTTIVSEDDELRVSTPVVRVENMLQKLCERHGKVEPTFILCLLPQKKNCDLYGPWKKTTQVDFGIPNQCIALKAYEEKQKLKMHQHVENVLLKINAKLGGFHSYMYDNYLKTTPVAMEPTMIVGMSVSHGSPGQTDIPPIAAVVGSQDWPSILKYMACVRTQGANSGMIDNLFKVSDGKDEGIFREVLDELPYRPDNIILFRGGVSESQFNKVLNIELNQIMKACKFLDENWNPKFMVIVAQKNHHTRFFQPGSVDNVPPGTVIDTEICHPRNYDFYLCAHAGKIGTTRPTHYHVLLDEIGFTPDELQGFVHSLSYINQRSTTAISVVAPIHYARLAATQMREFLKFDDDISEISSRLSASSTAPVPELPELHEDIKNTMFFC